MSAQTMPQLVEHINKWSQTKTVYWSMMKCAQRDFGGKAYMYPGIFGNRVLDLGLRRAVDIFDPMASGCRDSVKEQYKEYMNGICREMSSVEPNIIRQKQYKIYIEELDRRRGTNYKELFPTIAEWLDKV